MSTAILDFLKRHPEVETITQKFSESGHACVQEVDSVHSSIDGTMKKTELFSPLGVVRMLKSVRRRNPFKIIQMKPQDFLNIQPTQDYAFEKVPFTQVKQLIYQAEQPHSIHYKLLHSGPSAPASLLVLRSLRKERKATMYLYRSPK